MVFPTWFCIYTVNWVAERGFFCVGWRLCFLFIREEWEIMVGVLWKGQTLAT